MSALAFPLASMAEMRFRYERSGVRLITLQRNKPLTLKSQLLSEIGPGEKTAQDVSPHDGLGKRFHTTCMDGLMAAQYASGRPVVQGRPGGTSFVIQRHRNLLCTIAEALPCRAETNRHAVESLTSEPDMAIWGMSRASPQGSPVR